MHMSKNKAALQWRKISSKSSQRRLRSAVSFFTILFFALNNINILPLFAYYDEGGGAGYNYTPQQNLQPVVVPHIEVPEVQITVPTIDVSTIGMDSYDFYYFQLNTANLCMVGDFAQRVFADVETPELEFQAGAFTAEESLAAIQTQGAQPDAAEIKIASVAGIHELPLPDIELGDMDLDQLRAPELDVSAAAETQRLNDQFGSVQGLINAYLNGTGPNPFEDADVIDALADNLNPAELAATLSKAGTDPTLAAGILVNLPPETAVSVANLMTAQALGQVCAVMEPPVAAQLLSAVQPEVALQAVQNMDASKAADVFAALASLNGGPASPGPLTTSEAGNLAAQMLSQLPQANQTAVLASLTPVEIVAVLNQATPEQTQTILGNLPQAAVVQIIPQMAPEMASAYLNTLQPEAAASMLSQLPPENSAPIFNQMTPEQITAVLNAAAPEMLPALLGGMEPQTVNVFLASLSAETAALAVGGMDPSGALPIVGAMYPDRAAEVMQALPPEVCAQMVAADAGNAFANVLPALGAMTAVEVKEFLATLSPDIRAEVLQHMPVYQAAAVIRQFEPEQAAQIVAAMPDQQQAQAVSAEMQVQSGAPSAADEPTPGADPAENVKPWEGAPAVGYDAQTNTYTESVVNGDGTVTYTVYNGSDDTGAALHVAVYSAAGDPLEGWDFTAAGYGSAGQHWVRMTEFVDENGVKTQASGQEAIIYFYSANGQITAWESYNSNGDLAAACDYQAQVGNGNLGVLTRYRMTDSGMMVEQSDVHAMQQSMANGQDYESAVQEAVYGWVRYAAAGDSMAAVEGFNQYEDPGNGSQGVYWQRDGAVVNYYASSAPTTEGQLYQSVTYSGTGADAQVISGYNLFQETGNGQVGMVWQRVDNADGTYALNYHHRNSDGTAGDVFHSVVYDAQDREISGWDLYTEAVPGTPGIRWTFTYAEDGSYTQEYYHLTADKGQGQHFATVGYDRLGQEISNWNIYAPPAVQENPAATPVDELPLWYQSAYFGYSASGSTSPESMESSAADPLLSAYAAAQADLNYSQASVLDLYGAGGAGPVEDAPWFASPAAYTPALSRTQAELALGLLDPAYMPAGLGGSLYSSALDETPGAVRTRTVPVLNAANEVSGEERILDITIQGVTTSLYENGSIKITLPNSDYDLGFGPDGQMSVLGTDGVPLTAGEIRALPSSALVPPLRSFAESAASAGHDEIAAAVYSGLAQYSLAAGNMGALGSENLFAGTLVMPGAAEYSALALEHAEASRDMQAYAQASMTRAEVFAAAGNLTMAVNLLDTTMALLAADTSLVPALRAELGLRALENYNLICSLPNAPPSISQVSLLGEAQAVQLVVRGIDALAAQGEPVAALALAVRLNPLLETPQDITPLAVLILSGVDRTAMQQAFESGAQYYLDPHSGAVITPAESGGYTLQIAAGNNVIYLACEAGRDGLQATGVSVVQAGTRNIVQDYTAQDGDLSLNAVRVAVLTSLPAGENGVLTPMTVQVMITPGDENPTALYSHEGVLYQLAIDPGSMRAEATMLIDPSRTLPGYAAQGDPASFYFNADGVPVTMDGRAGVVREISGYNAAILNNIPPEMASEYALTGLPIYVTADGTVFYGTPDDIRAGNYFVVGNNTLSVQDGTGETRQVSYIAHYAGNELTSMLLDDAAGGGVEKVFDFITTAERNDPSFRALNLSGQSVDYAFTVTQSGPGGERTATSFYTDNGQLLATEVTLQNMGGLVLQYDAAGNLTETCLQAIRGGGSGYTFEALQSGGFALTAADGTREEYTSTGRRAIPSEGTPGTGQQQVMEFDILQNITLHVAQYNSREGQTVSYSDITKQTVVLQTGEDGQVTQIRTESSVLGEVTFQTTSTLVADQPGEPAWQVIRGTGTREELIARGYGDNDLFAPLVNGAAASTVTFQEGGSRRYDVTYQDENGFYTVNVGADDTGAAAYSLLGHLTDQPDVAIVAGRAAADNGSSLPGLRISSAVGTYEDLRSAGIAATELAVVGTDGAALVNGRNVNFLDDDGRFTVNFNTDNTQTTAFSLVGNLAADDRVTIIAGFANDADGRRLPGLQMTTAVGPAEALRAANIAAEELGHLGPDGTAVSVITTEDGGLLTQRVNYLNAEGDVTVSVGRDEDGAVAYSLVGTLADRAGQHQVTVISTNAENGSGLQITTAIGTAGNLTYHGFAVEEIRGLDGTGRAAPLGLDVDFTDSAGAITVSLTRNDNGSTSFSLVGKLVNDPGVSIIATVEGEGEHAQLTISTAIGTRQALDNAGIAEDEVAMLDAQGQAAALLRDESGNVRSLEVDYTDGEGNITVSFGRDKATGATTFSLIGRLADDPDVTIISGRVLDHDGAWQEGLQVTTAIGDRAALTAHGIATAEIAAVDDDGTALSPIVGEDGRSTSKRVQYTDRNGNFTVSFGTDEQQANATTFSLVGHLASDPRVTIVSGRTLDAAGAYRDGLYISTAIGPRDALLSAGFAEKWLEQIGTDGMLDMVVGDGRAAQPVLFTDDTGNYTVSFGAEDNGRTTYSVIGALLSDPRVTIIAGEMKDAAGAVLPTLEVMTAVGPASALRTAGIALEELGGIEANGYGNITAVSKRVGEDGTVYVTLSLERADFTDGSGNVTVSYGRDQNGHMTTSLLGSIYTGAGKVTVISNVRDAGLGLEASAYIGTRNALRAIDIGTAELDAAARGEGQLEDANGTVIYGRNGIYTIGVSWDGTTGMTTYSLSGVLVTEEGVVTVAASMDGVSRTLQAVSASGPEAALLAANIANDEIAQAKQGEADTLEGVIKHVPLGTRLLDWLDPDEHFEFDVGYSQNGNYQVSISRDRDGNQVYSLIGHATLDGHIITVIAAMNDDHKLEVTTAIGPIEVLRANGIGAQAIDLYHQDQATFIAMDIQTKEGVLLGRTVTYEDPDGNVTVQMGDNPQLVGYVVVGDQKMTIIAGVQASGWMGLGSGELQIVGFSGTAAAIRATGIGITLLNQVMNGTISSTQGGQKVAFEENGVYSFSQDKEGNRAIHFTVLNQPEGMDGKLHGYANSEGTSALMLGDQVLGQDDLTREGTLSWGIDAANERIVVFNTHNTTLQKFDYHGTDRSGYWLAVWNTISVPFTVLKDSFSDLMSTIANFNAAPSWGSFGQVLLGCLSVVGNAVVLPFHAVASFFIAGFQVMANNFWRQVPDWTHQALMFFTGGQENWFTNLVDHAVSFYASINYEINAFMAKNFIILVLVTATILLKSPQVAAMLGKALVAMLSQVVSYIGKTFLYGALLGGLNQGLLNGVASWVYNFYLRDFIDLADAISNLGKVLEDGIQAPDDYFAIADAVGLLASASLMAYFQFNEYKGWVGAAVGFVGRVVDAAGVRANDFAQGYKNAPPSGKGTPTVLVRVWAGLTSMVSGTRLTFANDGARNAANYIASRTDLSRTQRARTMGELAAKDITPQKIDQILGKFGTDLRSITQPVTFKSGSLGTDISLPKELNAAFQAIGREIDLGRAELATGNSRSMLRGGERLTGALDRLAVAMNNLGDVRLAESAFRLMAETGVRAVQGGETVPRTLSAAEAGRVLETMIRLDADNARPGTGESFSRQISENLAKDGGAAICKAAATELAKDGAVVRDYLSRGILSDSMTREVVAAGLADGSAARFAMDLASGKQGQMAVDAAVRAIEKADDSGARMSALTTAAAKAYNGEGKLGWDGVFQAQRSRPMEALLNASMDLTVGSLKNMNDAARADAFNNILRSASGSETTRAALAESLAKADAEVSKTDSQYGLAMRNAVRDAAKNDNLHTLARTVSQNETASKQFGEAVSKLMNDQVLPQRTVQSLADSMTRALSEGGQPLMRFLEGMRDVSPSNAQKFQDLMQRAIPDLIRDAPLQKIRGLEVSIKDMIKTATGQELARFLMSGVQRLDGDVPGAQKAQAQKDTAAAADQASENTARTETKEEPRTRETQRLAPESSSQSVHRTPVRQAQQYLGDAAAALRSALQSLTPARMGEMIRTQFAGGVSQLAQLLNGLLNPRAEGMKPTPVQENYRAVMDQAKPGAEAEGARADGKGRGLEQVKEGLTGRSPWHEAAVENLMRFLDPAEAQKIAGGQDITTAGQGRNAGKTAEAQAETTQQPRGAQPSGQRLFDTRAADRADAFLMPFRDPVRAFETVLQVASGQAFMQASISRILNNLFPEKAAATAAKDGQPQGGRLARGLAQVSRGVASALSGSFAFETAARALSGPLARQQAKKLGDPDHVSRSLDQMETRLKSASEGVERAAKRSARLADQRLRSVEARAQGERANFGRRMTDWVDARRMQRAQNRMMSNLTERSALLAGQRSLANASNLVQRAQETSARVPDLTVGEELARAMTRETAPRAGERLIKSEEALRTATEKFQADANRGDLVAATRSAAEVLRAEAERASSAEQVSGILAARGGNPDMVSLAAQQVRTTAERTKALEVQLAKSQQEYSDFGKQVADLDAQIAQARERAEAITAERGIEGRTDADVRQVRQLEAQRAEFEQKRDSAALEVMRDQQEIRRLVQQPFAAVTLSHQHAELARVLLAQDGSGKLVASLLERAPASQQTQIVRTAQELGRAAEVLRELPLESRQALASHLDTETLRATLDSRLAEVDAQAQRFTRMEDALRAVETIDAEIRNIRETGQPVRSQTPSVRPGSAAAQLRALDAQRTAAVERVAALTEPGPRAAPASAPIAKLDQSIQDLTQRIDTLTATAEKGASTALQRMANSLRAQVAELQLQRAQVFATELRTSQAQSLAMAGDLISGRPDALQLLAEPRYARAAAASASTTLRNAVSLEGRTVVDKSTQAAVGQFRDFAAAQTDKPFAEQLRDFELQQPEAGRLLARAALELYRQNGGDAATARDFESVLRTQDPRADLSKALAEFNARQTTAGRPGLPPEAARLSEAAALDRLITAEAKQNQQQILRAEIELGNIETQLGQARARGDAIEIRTLEKAQNQLQKQLTRFLAADSSRGYALAPRTARVAEGTRLLHAEMQLGVAMTIHTAVEAIQGRRLAAQELQAAETRLKEASPDDPGRLNELAQARDEARARLEAAEQLFQQKVGGASLTEAIELAWHEHYQSVFKASSAEQRQTYLDEAAALRTELNAYLGSFERVPGTDAIKPDQVRDGQQLYAAFVQFRNKLIQDGRIQPGSLAEARLVRVYAEIAFQRITGYEGMREAQKIMLSEFLRQHNVGLEAGGGKTNPFIMYPGMAFLMTGDAVRAEILVDDLAAIEKYIGEKQARTGLPQGELARAFGMELRDGNRLFEQAKQTGDYGEFVRALQDPRQVVIFDHTTRGHLRNADVTNPLLRAALGETNLAGIDEVHMAATSQTSAIIGGHVTRPAGELVRRVDWILDRLGFNQEAYRTGVRDPNSLVGNGFRVVDIRGQRLTDEMAMRFNEASAGRLIVLTDTGVRVNLEAQNALRGFDSGELSSVLRVVFSEKGKAGEYNAYAIGGDGLIYPVDHLGKIQFDQISNDIAGQAAAARINGLDPHTSVRVNETTMQTSLSAMYAGNSALIVGASGTIAGIENLMQAKIGSGSTHISTSLFDVEKLINLTGDQKTYTDRGRTIKNQGGILTSEEAAHRVVVDTVAAMRRNVQVFEDSPGRQLDMVSRYMAELAGLKDQNGQRFIDRPVISVMSAEGAGYFVEAGKAEAFIRDSGINAYLRSQNLPEVVVRRGADSPVAGMDYVEIKDGGIQAIVSRAGIIKDQIIIFNRQAAVGKNFQADLTMVVFNGHRLTADLATQLCLRSGRPGGSENGRWATTRFMHVNTGELLETVRTAFSRSPELGELWRSESSGNVLRTLNELGQGIEALRSLPANDAKTQAVLPEALKISAEYRQSELVADSTRFAVQDTFRDRIVIDPLKIALRRYAEADTSAGHHILKTEMNRVLNAHSGEADIALRLLSTRSPKELNDQYVASTFLRSVAEAKTIWKNVFLKTLTSPSAWLSGNLGFAAKQWLQTSRAGSTVASGRAPETIRSNNFNDARSFVELYAVGRSLMKGVLSRDDGGAIAGGLARETSRILENAKSGPLGTQMRTDFKTAWETSHQQVQGMTLQKAMTALHTSDEVVARLALAPSYQLALSMLQAGEMDERFARPPQPGVRFNLTPANPLVRSVNLTHGALGEAVRTLPGLGTAIRNYDLQRAEVVRAAIDFQARQDRESQDPETLAGRFGADWQFYRQASSLLKSASPLAPLRLWFLIHRQPAQAKWQYQQSLTQARTLQEAVAKYGNGVNYTYQDKQYNYVEAKAFIDQNTYLARDLAARYGFNQTAPLLYGALQFTNKAMARLEPNLPVLAGLLKSKTFLASAAGTALLLAIFGLSGLSLPALAVGVALTLGAKILLPVLQNRLAQGQPQGQSNPWLANALAVVPGVLQGNPGLAVGSVVGSLFAEVVQAVRAHRMDPAKRYWLDPTEVQVKRLTEPAGRTAAAIQVKTSKTADFYEQWETALAARADADGVVSDINAVEAFREVWSRYGAGKFLSVARSAATTGWMRLLAAGLSLMPEEVLRSEALQEIEIGGRKTGQVLLPLSDQVFDNQVPEMLVAQLLGQAAGKLWSAKERARMEKDLERLAAFEPSLGEVPKEQRLLAYLQSYLWRGDEMQARSAEWRNRAKTGRTAEEKRQAQQAAALSASLYGRVEKAFGGRFTPLHRDRISKAMSERQGEVQGRMAQALLDYRAASGLTKRQQAWQFQQNFGLSIADYLRLQTPPLGLRLLKRISPAGEFDRQPAQTLFRSIQRGYVLGGIAVAAGIFLLAAGGLPIAAIAAGGAAAIFLAGASLMHAQSNHILQRIEPDYLLNLTLAKAPGETFRKQLLTDRMEEGLTELAQSRSHNWLQAHAVGVVADELFRAAIQVASDKKTPSEIREERLRFILEDCLFALNLPMRIDFNVSGGLIAQATPTAEPAAAISQNRRLARLARIMESHGVKIDIQFRVPEPRRLQKLTGSSA